MTDIHHRTMILMAAVALLAAACGSAEPAVPAPTNDVTTKPTATSTPANDVTTEPTATNHPAATITTEAAPQ